MDSNPLATELSGVRSKLTPLIRQLQELADQRPSSGAEITLALRHLQDCRMRLGVAEALERGLDPWANQIK